MIYIFADCVLDTQRYILCRAGRHTRLRPKVFQMLMYFLTHGDRVVSKQELCEQVWSARVVSDAAMENCLKALRQIIGKVRRGPAALAVTPLVGRTRELAALQAVWTQVEVGQGHVVGIVGEPGMGKSRLVHEFCRSLRGGPHTYVRGYCVSYGQAMPYQPVRALLQHACGITEADSPAAIAAKV